MAVPSLSQPRVVNRFRRTISSKVPYLNYLWHNKIVVGLIVFVLCYSLFIYQSLLHHNKHNTNNEDNNSSSNHNLMIAHGAEDEAKPKSALKDVNTVPQQQQQEKILSSPAHNSNEETSPAPHKDDPSSMTDDDSQCAFRHYSDRRYYGLSNPQQPDFLSQAEYIYGERPIVLDQIKQRHKLCVDQTEWLDRDDQNKLPFADGTNPSILHIDRLQETPHYHALKQIGVTFLATICMTNSQCQWRDTPEELVQNKLSTRDTPNTLRTVLLFLNDNFQVLHESTILFERNANWGKRKLKPVIVGNGGKYGTQIRALDDARLFVYQNNIWISFRDGPAFGYDKQVLNPLHLESLSSISSSQSQPKQQLLLQQQLLRVTIRASETLTFCCGRNMALITPSPAAGAAAATVDLTHTTLQALTWVDPVTVIDVHTVGTNNEIPDNNNKNKKKHHHQRRLGTDTTKKSHIHGTNAFMVPYGENNELLGMAHFHRPNDRNENVYARFGHHYTHAFFTIAPTDIHPTTGITSSSFHLKRLSAEFVLPSQHHPHDAEVIQFISGLELHGNDVVLAWGINDCEGAAGTISIDAVNQLLRPVETIGMEVVDFMKTSTSEALSS